MELIVSKISSDIKEMCEILGYNMWYVKEF
jgi:hypothetical protein